MTGRSDHTRNFCNNIKAYHEKKEAQFYDFTIKSKDGVEVKSHKFILASQSEYFAGLFRVHPTASETTFKDFSLDVIKKCIEYLYTHKVNLTRNNVEDVLKFADYINLTDVIDICTKFIIKNINQSNCTQVISLGNGLSIDQLVEAGVLFVVRNLGHDIGSLDIVTKKMVIKVARLQEQRVTVMTTEQWNINRLKPLLMVPKDETGFQVRCSSVFCCNTDNWGPKLAIDGEVSRIDEGYFHSQLEKHPWLEVKLPSPVLVSSLTIINRVNGCWQRLRNLEVRAGMEPVPEGFTAHERGNDSNKQIEVNSRCGYFAGPASRFLKKGHVIVFDQPTIAQYITMQILDVEYLQINGIKFNGGDLLNYEDSAF